MVAHSSYKLQNFRFRGQQGDFILYIFCPWDVLLPLQYLKKTLQKALPSHTAEPRARSGIISLSD